MARKRKTLPKGFEELLKTGDIESLKTVFDTCEIEAYGGYNKHTAIAYDSCPDELVTWLVEDQGADIDKIDHYGYTPLQNRASSCWQGNIKILLELGADVTLCKDLGGTALHSAVGSQCLENTELLLTYGAKVNQKDKWGELTPLEYALQQCMPAYILETTKIAKVLVDSGAKVSSKAKEYVVSIGKRFEFHRDNYEEQSVDATSDALDKLYELLQVEPVARKVVYDNKSEIIILEKKWQKQHEELWNMLVPSSGHAVTVQGEVIRIAGRIGDEVDRNGGTNWDKDYKKMANAYLSLISTGEPLPSSTITKAKSILSSAAKREEKSHLLAKYAVEWVNKNRMPEVLSEPEYKR